MSLPAELQRRPDLPAPPPRPPRAPAPQAERSEVPVGAGHDFARIAVHAPAGVLQRQEAAPPPQADPAKRRVDAAVALVERLKKEGTKYKQQEKRDWDATDFADCSKFVQWALEGAGQPDLFGGRENARTAMMQELIRKAAGENGAPFRLSDPKPGDIMMWGGHVGIVVEVTEVKGKKKLVFAHMGSSGARLLGKSDNGYYWLDADDTAKIDSMGSGEWLGYWTP